VSKVTDTDKEQGNEIGSDEPKEKVMTTSTRRFQESWLSMYKWLKYDDAMFCKVCIDGNRQNTFTTGSTNYGD